jgi:hypothetical protein
VGSSADSGLLRARFLILAGWAGLLGAIVLATRGGPGGDWNYFREGYPLLVHGSYDEPHRFTTLHYGGGGLHLYAQHPFIQIGPLALLVFRLVAWLEGISSVLGVVLTIAVGLATLRSLERLAGQLALPRRGDVRRLTLIVGPFLMYAWVQAFVAWRHLDDMLVIVGVTVAVFAIVHRRPWLLGLAIGLSVAAKPTAVAVVPLLFAFEWRNNARAVAAAGLVVAATWMPFALADLGTMHAGVPQMTVQTSSGLTALGFSYDATPPHLLRLLQLAIALLVGTVAMMRGRWYLVPLLGFGIRTALDPNVVSYYAVTLIFAAIIADMIPAPRAPLNTILCWLAFSEPFSWRWTPTWPAPSAGVQAWIRLGVPVALVVLLLLRSDRRTGEDTELKPPEAQRTPLEVVAVASPA